MTCKGEMRNVHNILVRKHKGKSLLLRRIWGDNIKICVKRSSVLCFGLDSFDSG